MQFEQDFMSRIVGGRVNNILDLNRFYVEDIGNIFIESMKNNNVHFINIWYKKKEFKWERLFQI